ncbi:NrtA/SsuA/CpmA family ABC transporter substrate-binding protein [Methylobacterium sp. E-041]|jgi:ABC-type nitrate/sulfonate/bicarbonate transport system substrate-binding protein|uniref:ABC transporter substrate-binding protein n=1 Tax=unclassified Methylobacterium TaxID=2615210 RepID=UPI0011C89862|nr:MULTISPECIES: NrtA/SsuA/CpmA family ABC transporter substrate-binding protein [unclassified Methylobacterium]MCJ2007730.1 NrtA/SsuA/CpmA family ABC transporter substrate-binding protein [Methylobacterium sp. J-092]MCJ2042272.1 NrtA/SsuA/CpmA family ABC transporter substrate-binding protein [Methylobacterium sp. J-059]MCJ2075951.1 NrtA/SsuA/CpmA family ABC transporter substrate-binding protein [Methylobacterium sp. E-016]MCJ2107318.1 NrtA/SsuA/CpmA family ABC transporter substrate-binding pro
MIDRRTLLAGLGAGLVSAPFVARAAEPVTIRMGSLKLIHSIAPYFYERFTPAGTRVEVIPFESPTECKNAVVTKSVDFGTFGIASATLGAAAGEPLTVIASTCNGGMAIISRKDSDIRAIKDLKGKRVALWPGSTQEVFALERMRMEGLSIRDIVPVRISFSEMHIALARGDIDAYVGAEPAPGVSLSSGVGQLVEYPYGTAMGSLNMVFGTHRDTIASKPDLVRTMLEIHRKGTEFAAKNRDAMIDMAVAKLGQKREALAISAPNVDLTWQLGPDEVKKAEAYAQHMLALKQIKRLPEPGFIDTTFVDAMRDA